MDNENKDSVRGAQLLLAGIVLKQYCTAGEEEDDESEDGVDIIDVRISLPRFAPAYTLSLIIGRCKLDRTVISC